MSFVCLSVACRAFLKVIMILFGFVGEIAWLHDFLILIAKTIRRNFSFLF